MRPAIFLSWRKLTVQKRNFIFKRFHKNWRKVLALAFILSSLPVFSTDITFFGPGDLFALEELFPQNIERQYSVERIKKTALKKIEMEYLAALISDPLFKKELEIFWEAPEVSGKHVIHMFYGLFFMGDKFSNQLDVSIFDERIINQSFSLADLEKVLIPEKPLKQEDQALRELFLKIHQLDQDPKCDACSIELLSSSQMPKINEDKMLIASHILISLANLNIIDAVFSKAYFDPYSVTTSGNNLIHSFIELHHLRQLFNLSERAYYAEALSHLLDKAPKSLINQENLLGDTPLSMAALFGQTEAVEILLKKIDPNSFYPYYPLLKTRAVPYLEMSVLLDLYKNRPYFENRSFEKHPNTIKSFDFSILFNNLIDHFIEEGVGQNFQDSQNLIQIIESLYRSSENREKNRMALIHKFYDYGDYLNTNQKKMISFRLYNAILNKDINSFKSILLSLDGLKPNQPQSENLKDLKIYALEEAIRNHFLEGVELFLTHQTVPFDHKLINIDPIFMSLLSYAVLDPDNPNSVSAKKIIPVVMDYFESRKRLQFLGLSPVFWSAFLGLFDELKYFVEEKQLPLEQFFSFSKKHYIDIEDYTRGQEFLKTNSYIRSKLNIPTDQCERLFLQ